MKNIVHLTFDMRIGGAEQVILSLAVHTDSERFHVQILCLDPHIGPFGRQMQEKGITVEALDRHPGFDFSLIKKIRRFFLSRRIDVAHCHQYTPFVYGVLAAIGTQTKIIFTEHGRFYPDTRRPKRVLANPLLSLITAHITAISSATRQALIDYENFSPKKIRVIYNGIDDKRFVDPGSHVTSDFKNKLHIPENARILGTVARLDSIKNQPMMLKAFKEIHHSLPDTYLLIIGDGPEREKLEQLTRDLDIESRVIFTGFKENTHLYYKIMDLFLLTSFSEGTAMTLLEAMASSVPCIATNVGGNPEIVVHNETGTLVPDNDHHALAEAVISLLQDQQKIDRFGKQGRTRFENLFSVQKMVDAYQYLYEN